MEKIESIYKVIHYMYKWHDIRKLRYPTFKVKWHEYAYFNTLDEIESYVLHQAQMWNKTTEVFPVDSKIVYHYAYVIIEIPIGVEVNAFHLGQNLSVRIYLPDGTLWGVKPYADFFPRYGLDSDGFNYWGKKNQFWGRDPEEIKFKPGDIVEILGYPGNGYWSEDEVNLAIIVKTPPTKEEVAEMKKLYLATHSGFDICDHALCREFGSHLDTYEVLSQCSDSIDHASTISVFPLTKPISSRRRKALQALYDKYLETVKDNDDTLRTIDETKNVTLENFMERTAYIEEGNSNEEG
jgi:hypothetical protein